MVKVPVVGIYGLVTNSTATTIAKEDQITVDVFDECVTPACLSAPEFTFSDFFAPSRF